jgi:acetyl esterase/lipase
VLRGFCLLLAPLLLAASLEGQAKKAPAPRPIPDAHNDLDVNYLQNWRDVPLAGVYGPLPRTRLNVHWPKGDGPFPCVIFVHGGGFGEGHKDLGGACTGGGADLIDMAVRNGFVAANVNYILGENIFPQVYWDFRAAVRFLRKNADMYHIDPNRMAAWGHSAGGMLIAACNYPDAGQWHLGGRNKTPAGWLPISDSKDPVAGQIASSLQKGERFFLVPMDDPHPLYREYSSRLQVLAFDLSHLDASITPDDPATVTFIGGAGPHDMQEACTKAGLDFLAIQALDEKFKTQKHLHVPNFKGPALGEDGKSMVEIRERVFQFFKQQLVTKPRSPSVEFRPNSRVFGDKVQVEFITPSTNTKIYYTLDGSEPTTQSLRYEGPITIGATTTIKVITVHNNWRSSGTATAAYLKGSPPPSIQGPDSLPRAKVGQEYVVRFNAETARPVVWNCAMATSTQSIPKMTAQEVVKQGRQKGFASLIGLNFEPEKGVLTGTPTVAGNWVVQVQCGWKFGDIADARTYVLTVDP